nr:gephyrin-like molybdotransferase receptor GlpR [Nocardia australiensis]
MTTPADEPVTEIEEIDAETTPDSRSAAFHSGVTEIDIDEFDDADTEFDDSETNDVDIDGSDAESDIESDSTDARTAANLDAAADDDLVSDERTDPVAATIPAAPAPVVDDESDSADTEFVPSRRGRGGFDPEADAIARATRYTFRQRAVLGLLLGSILFGALGIVMTPLFWWACGLSTIVLVTYLAYLRKQVRMEEDIRRRRAARLSRTEPAEEQPQASEQQPHQRTMDRDTARALRRRSVLLESDDEDPMFEQLETFDTATARALRNRTGDMRRAAGE